VIVLHNYFRSSASYRVRIALNLKGLSYEYVSVHLNRNGGEQFSEGFQRLNPQSLVPVMGDGETTTSQSMAILEYLEERHPSVRLLPEGLADRAYVRSLAMHVACDVHPLNNLRVLKYLTGKLKVSDEQKSEWILHWIATGLQALETETSSSPRRGRFCFGDSPTLADCCLVPQVFSAERFGLKLDAYPTLMGIARECDALDAFRSAHPSVQPDSE